jgi:hypothetical protein
MGVSINGGTGTLNGWFIVEKPIEMDDLGIPHLWKPPNGGYPKM